MIVAEGAHDQELQAIKPEKVKNLLSDRLKLDTRITTLGHVQRGGQACAYDRQLSTLQGVEAVRAVLEATPETPSPFVAIIENKIVRKSLLDAVDATNSITHAIEAKDFDLAMKLRGEEFGEYYDAYMTTTSVDQPYLRLHPEKVILSITYPRICLTYLIST